MTEHPLTMPELALVAGTRVALGAGFGLLLADQLSPNTRRAVGWALLAVGILSTPPLAMHVLSQHEPRADLLNYAGV